MEDGRLQIYSDRLLWFSEVDSLGDFGVSAASAARLTAFMAAWISSRLK